MFVILLTNTHVCLIFYFSHIYDPTPNKYVILDAITFESDKDKAKKILDSTPSTPPPATAYGGVPYQPPNPGGYPTAAPTYPAQGGYPPPPSGSGYGQPPPGGINFQFGVGAPGAPPYSQQQVPPPGEVNMQFGLGGFGMPTISFQSNPSQQPPPWP